MTHPAVAAYLRKLAQKAGQASAAARRELRDRVAAGIADPEERERYMALCAHLQGIAAAGGKARARKRLTPP